jgi:hypothetical protein
MHGSRGGGWIRAQCTRTAPAPTLGAQFLIIRAARQLDPPVGDIGAVPHGADGILGAHERASKSDAGLLEISHPRPKADSLAQVTCKSLGRRRVVAPPANRTV